MVTGLVVISFNLSSLLRINNRNMFLISFYSFANVNTLSELLHMILFCSSQLLFLNFILYMLNDNVLHVEIEIDMNVICK